MGSLAWLQALCEHAFLGDDVNPLDEVLFFHRMVDAADVDDDLVAFDGGHGNMLFLCRVSRVGLEDAHGLSAARQRAAPISDFHDDVAANLATIKRRSFHG